MQPSHHLLLHSLRACLGSAPAAVSRRVQGEEGIESATLAMRSSLSFQFLQALGASGQGGLPSESLKALVAQIRHTCVRNALLQRRLRQLVEACEAEGVQVILVKGLWLVHCVYRDAAAREAGDIDLLLRPGDVGRFTRIVQRLGFTVPPKGASLSAEAHSTNEFALRHPDDGLLVDVHWSLTNPVTERQVDEDLLWQRSELVDLAGVRCRTLKLEDHLLYLCFHAAVHHKLWAVGPRCLYDVALVLRQPPRPIRWNELVDGARALGWERAAWLMFSLVEEHLGVAIPATVLQALHQESPPDAEVRRVALETIFAAQEQESVYRHLARMLAPGSTGRSLSALWQLLLPSRVQMTNQYGVCPGTPTWVLHLKRWALKLRDWTPEFGALLAGGRAQREELSRMRQLQQWLDARA